MHWQPHLDAELQCSQGVGQILEELGANLLVSILNTLLFSVLITTCLDFFVRQETIQSPSDLSMQSRNSDNEVIPGVIRSMKDTKLSEVLITFCKSHLFVDSW